MDPYVASAVDLSDIQRLTAVFMLASVSGVQSVLAEFVVVQAFAVLIQRRKRRDKSFISRQRFCDWGVVRG